MPHWRAANAPPLRCGRPPSRRTAGPPGPGHWLPGVALGAAGARSYHLYRPPGLRPTSLERVPLVVTGGICSFAQAESILSAGHADVVGAARQSLADPDWWEKVRTGQGGLVRRCVFTNYCEALDQRHRQVTCQLWDRIPDAPGESASRTSDGRRRLVAPPWIR